MAENKAAEKETITPPGTVQTGREIGPESSDGAETGDEQIARLARRKK